METAIFLCTLEQRQGKECTGIMHVSAAYILTDTVAYVIKAVCAHFMAYLVVTIHW